MIDDFPPQPVFILKRRKLAHVLHEGGNHLVIGRVILRKIRQRQAPAPAPETHCLGPMPHRSAANDDTDRPDGAPASA